MKTPIPTLILLATLSLNVYAQQEIPMFFDNEMMLQTNINRLVAYSPDGSKIATIGRGKIAVFDATTGREIIRIAGHSNNVISDFVFSPNGRQIITCSSDDTTVKIWDAVSGALVRNISQAGVGRISFSPDGSRIVGYYSILTFGVGSEYGIKIWNTANGSEIRTIVLQAFVRSITYSPNGRQILAATNEGIIIWDAGNGQIIRTIDSEILDNASFNPNGQYISAYATNRENNVYEIKIINATTGQEVRSIPVRLGATTNLLYSPDGRQLLVNASGGNIKIFDPDTGRELRTFNNSDRAFAFSPDGQKILTSSHSFSLRLEGEDRYSGASYATLLDAATGRVTGTIGYGPLNVGARAYADLQIARFLNDTAAVNRHETVLQYIIGRGNATRAEIETFYRNNVRAMISGVVDSEFSGITVPATTITEVVKNPLFVFLRSPDQASFNAIRTILNSIEAGRRLQETYDQYMWAYNLFSALEEVAGTASESADALRNARVAQNNLNEIRRTLRAPNDAPIDWTNFRSAYERILNGFNPELVRRMR